MKIVDDFSFLFLDDPAATIAGVRATEVPVRDVPEPPPLADAPLTYAALCSGLAQVAAADSGYRRQAVALREQVADWVSRFIAIDAGV